MLVVVEDILVVVDSLVVEDNLVEEEHLAEVDILAEVVADKELVDMDLEAENYKLLIELSNRIQLNVDQSLLFIGRNTLQLNIKL